MLADCVWGYDVGMQYDSPQTILRLGVVNFLNTVPLIDGLASVEGIELIPKVPSELISCIENCECDLALASSIDYQRCQASLKILPAGVLSSDGETLTVRLCSRIQFEEIKEIHCDTDSHTSVALVQIILKQVFGSTPKIVSSDIRSLVRNNAELPQSVLVIGDKVVTHIFDSDYSYQMDLGQAWKDQTGLPFVFATWFGRSNLSQILVQRASILLDRQLRCNMNRIEQVVSAQACTRGWNTNTAMQYLTHHMQYQWSSKHAESLSLFYELALSCGVIDTVRPLHFFSE